MAIKVKSKPLPMQAPASRDSSPGLEGDTPKQAGGIKRRETITTEQFEITGELALVVNQIKETYSPAVIRRGTSKALDYGRVPSNILAVDICLAGGLLLSRGSMVYGNKSAGKSTIADKFVANVQRRFPDKAVAYIDIEGTKDKPWMARHGVDLDRLLLVEPESGESAIDMACALVAAAETSMIVTDSIAFLTPMKEIEGSAEDSLPGIHARLIGNYLRRLNNQLLVERHRGHFPLVLHINQFRMSIGQMFGDPRVLPGGKALEFATTQQIEISNKEVTGAAAKKSKGEDAGSENSSMVVYNEHTVKITKDKSGGRLKEAKFKMIRDESQGLPVGYIDQSKSIINQGLSIGLLAGAAQSFSHAHYGKWRGQPDFVQWLVQNPEAERDLVQTIVNHYREKWGVS